MSAILEIELWPRWQECAICGEVTPVRWGLPVDRCGDLVPNDYEGEWGGVPACQDCHDAHARGELTAANQDAWRKRQELIRRAHQAAFTREDYP